MPFVPSGLNAWRGRATVVCGVPGLSTPAAGPSEGVKQEEDPIKVFLGQSADLRAATVVPVPGKGKTRDGSMGGFPDRFQTRIRLLIRVAFWICWKNNPLNCLDDKQPRLKMGPFCRAESLPRSFLNQEGEVVSPVLIFSPMVKSQTKGNRHSLFHN